MDYYSYRQDPFWRGKRLTPAQLQVHDIVEGRRDDGHDQALDIREVGTTELTSQVLKTRQSPLDHGMPSALQSVNQSERQQLEKLAGMYGWMQSLRLEVTQQSTKVRWIHIPSTFPDNIQGVFCGLSDWANTDPTVELRRIGRTVRTKERSSNHGRFFSPFFKALGTDLDRNDGPILMSFPFLDWTVYPGPAPPMRYQIDEREAYNAGKTSRHPMRSILQYHYRLEDTTERERSQIYYKHRPWQNDRDVDLRVRRTDGTYPSSLAVDELWILVVDKRHIITFSSNQTWKSRWPAMQLSARIVDLSFLGLRKARQSHSSYSAHLHALVCIHGALGLVNRNFSEGLPLPCTERYAQYLGHLQYRVYKSPSTKLLMDLLQLQDELSIIVNITKAQEHLLLELQAALSRAQGRADDNPTPSASASPSPSFRSIDADSPVSKVVGHLHAELDDLTELGTSSKELVQRTVQLVTIRLEDHSYSITTFTIVTIIFLPLNFISSYFGMNLSDIRNVDSGQWLFWAVAASLTFVVVAVSTVFAFYGNEMIERLHLWRTQRPVGRLLRENFHRPAPQMENVKALRDRGFTVLDVTSSEVPFGVGSW